MVNTASLRPGEIRHRGRRVLHSDSFEQLQRREVDTFHVAAAQRPVHATWRTGGWGCTYGGFPRTAAPHQRKRARGSDLKPVHGFPCGPEAGVNRTWKPNMRRYVITLFRSSDPPMSFTSPGFPASRSEATYRPGDIEQRPRSGFGSTDRSTISASRSAPPT